MHDIQGILFEPGGCLAEFPAEPFIEIAAQVFGRKRNLSKSGSRSYWHLLNLMQTEAPQGDVPLDLELEAIRAASVYEDVAPALSELKTMGIQLLIASSLSSLAVTRFVEIHSLGQFFSAVWTRDNAGGVKAEPLLKAITCSGLRPEHTMFLTDTAEGLKAAKSAGVNAVLMMNDPDEA